MSASQEIRLDFPITDKHGEEYSTLTMRRRKLRDQILASKKGKGDLEREEVITMAALCEVDESVIHELDDFDLKKVQSRMTMMISASIEDMRAAVITLASVTGWSMQEILDMDEEDFMAWLKALPQPSNSPL